jgi:hypothetical protein
MIRREDRRAQHIAGWYEKDLAKLLGALAPGYQFDDPAEPRPVTRADLAGYTQRWDDRAQGKNEWILEHEVRQDKDGIQTNWHWWQVIGTNLTGAAVVKTSDEGVFLERTAYLTRKHPSQRL